MRLLTTFLALALLPCSLLNSLSLASEPSPNRTLTLDAIDLVRGNQTPGLAQHAIEHEGYTYYFASTEHKDLFLKDPTKYEVADGGACGAMGPLSGLGDARRHVVHQGKIYFFASDGCRASFLKDPTTRIETDDPPLTPTPEQLASGRATLDRFLAWSTGQSKQSNVATDSTKLIRNITSYKFKSTRKETHQNKEYTIVNEAAFAFPDRFMTKEAWNDSWFANIRSGHQAAAATPSTIEPLARARAHAFDRALARWPIILLKAYASPSPQLTYQGDGEGTIGESSVDFVKVSLNNATSRLAIEKSTGRLVQLSYRGRDSTSSIGDVVRTYTAYATVDGITLPIAYSVTFNGKDLAAAAWNVDTFTLNQPLEASLFQTSSN